VGSNDLSVEANVDVHENADTGIQTQFTENKKEIYNILRL